MSATLPLPDERIYAPYKIKALVEVLMEQGVPTEDSLRGSGVTHDDLTDPSVLTSMRQYLTVCLNAITLQSDPATSFELGTRLRVSAYGMYGYALLSCLSIRDYFRLAMKYRRLATPPMAIAWREYDDVAVWSFPDVFVLDTPQILKRFLIEQQFSLHVTHLQDVAGTRCPPLRASFAYDAPEFASLYEEYLHCPCKFGQPQTELVYERVVLDQKPMMAHALTSALMQETCDRLIGQEKIAVGTSGTVYRILMERPGRFPSMEEVAGKLYMTSRTLRRRLADEGTAFQTIADDVRASLAREYLSSTKFSVLDIALLLGFSDAAAFRKALKRWTGKGPGQLR